MQLPHIFLTLPALGTVCQLQSVLLQVGLSSGSGRCLHEGRVTDRHTTEHLIKIAEKLCTHILHIHPYQYNKGRKNRKFTKGIGVDYTVSIHIGVVSMSLCPLCDLSAALASTQSVTITADDTTKVQHMYRYIEF